ncbi:MAG: type 1 glutamine amidotransferase domain-containing protein [Bacteroidales bacterium]|nr:type 1 glutamine amidotransferase [Bacteroidales bacterium]
MGKLKGKKIAILSMSGFETSELFEPKKALEKEGVKVYIVSPESSKIKGWKDGNWYSEIDVDVMVYNTKVNDFDALVIPGGVINPDKLRRDQASVQFVKDFILSKKPVAAICHGPQMLIEAEVVNGRTLTSFYSIKKDLQNAGAKWIDQDVVVDNGLITSRNPSDLVAFNKKIVEALQK